MTSQLHQTNQFSISSSHYVYTVDPLLASTDTQYLKEQQPSSTNSAIPNLPDLATAPQDPLPTSPKKTRFRSRKRPSVDVQIEPITPAQLQDEDEDEDEDEESPVMSYADLKSDFIRKRNRVAAKKCREKAKAHAMELEHLARSTLLQNRILTNEIAQLQAEAYRMKKICIDHACCDDHPPIVIRPNLASGTSVPTAQVLDSASSAVTDRPPSAARRLSWEEDPFIL